MNAATVLTAVNEIKNYNISVQVTEILDRLKAEAEKDIRQQAAKTTGNGNRQKAAERFIKNCKKLHPTKPALHGAFIQNDIQYFTDAYSAFSLPQPLPLENIPENAEPLKVADFIKNARENNGEKLQLPTIAELKAYIKIKKAEKKPFIIYDFGESLPAVNAEFLLYHLEINPEAVATISAKIPLISPIYFIGYHGESILLPVRKDTKR